MTELQHEGEHEYLGFEDSVEELDLPDHLIIDLRKAGYLTIGQLLSATEEELQRIPKGSYHTWGKASVAKVQVALAKEGLPKIPRFITRKYE